VVIALSYIARRIAIPKQTRSPLGSVLAAKHEAWNNNCPVRKTELAKVKSAYDSRQPYHFVPMRRGTEHSSAPVPSVTSREGPTAGTAPGYRRPRVNPTLSQSERESRSVSPHGGVSWCLGLTGGSRNLFPGIRDRGT
jgi:hypothetical protein